jgi:hypothetical protein
MKKLLDLIKKWEERGIRIDSLCRTDCSERKKHIVSHINSDEFAFEIKLKDSDSEYKMRTTYGYPDYKVKTEIYYNS